MIDVFSSPPEDRLQSISLIEESRETVCESAANCIRTEQLRQKRQYDKKVIENRYNVTLFVSVFIYLISEYFRCDIKEGDKILYTNIPKNEKEAENQESGQVCWSFYSF